MLQAAAAVSTSSFLQADAAQLPFRPATCDALLCVAAIPYLPDLARAVAEWRRVAQPGADLVFTTPGADGIATLRLIRQAAADHGFALPDHASLGTSEQIADTLDSLELLPRQVEERTYPDSLDADPRTADDHWLEYGFLDQLRYAPPATATLSMTASSPLIVSCKLPAPANTSPYSRGALSGANRDTRTWSRTPLIVRAFARSTTAGSMAVEGHGGIIPDADRQSLAEMGVAQVFTPGATMSEIVSWVRASVGVARPS
jgi:hypothetical protein